jgi:L-fucose mutarotase
MGHGDEIALVYGNYPAETDAGGADGLVRADGVHEIELLDAILAVIPIDTDVEHGVMIATVGGDGRTLDPVHLEMCDAVARRTGRSAVLAMRGAELYARVRKAHSIVATSEPRL